MKKHGTLFMIITLILAMVGSLAPASQSALAAAPTELFFTEYIEGSSNNKALEIYNGTGTAINLGVGGYNVQMFFIGNPVSTLTINLTGSVADGDVYVLAQSSANATILAQADQTNGSGWFNGDDAVVAAKRYRGHRCNRANRIRPRVRVGERLGRFEEVLLSSGGRLKQPTNVTTPGDAALALQAQKAAFAMHLTPAMARATAIPCE